MLFLYKMVFIIGVILGIGFVLVECMIFVGIFVIIIGCCKDCFEVLVEKYGSEKVVVELFDVLDLDVMFVWVE